MVLRTPVRTLSITAVAAVVGVATAGCGGHQVSGQALPERGRALSHIGTALAQLLPDPTKFPAPYDAVVLSEQAVAEAAGDTTPGLGAGTRVSPAKCRPAGQAFGPDRSAAVVGTDENTRATITVALTRTDQPLTQRRDQITRCASMTMIEQGATAVVKSKLQPPPQTDADDTIAVEQTVIARGQNRDMLTLIGQVGDVRISATYMRFTASTGGGDVIGGTEDTSALDTLFTDTVLQVRKG